MRAHRTSSWAAWLLSACLLTGVSHAQIRIGQPSGFTGSVATGVKENTDGARLYFDAVNARGGVNGQKIELISVDDKFDPKLTPDIARKLITEQGVVALFLNRGTPHSQALLPVIERRLALVAGGLILLLVIGLAASHFLGGSSRGACAV